MARGVEIGPPQVMVQCSWAMACCLFFGAKPRGALARGRRCFEPTHTLHPILQGTKQREPWSFVHLTPIPGDIHHETPVSRVMSTELSP